jgi:hypothetical protein
MQERTIVISGSSDRANLENEELETIFKDAWRIIQRDFREENGDPYRHVEFEVREFVKGNEKITRENIDDAVLTIHQSCEETNEKHVRDGKRFLAIVFKEVRPTLSKKDIEWLTQRTDKAFTGWKRKADGDVFEEAMAQCLECIGSARTGTCPSRG